MSSKSVQAESIIGCASTFCKWSISKELADVRIQQRLGLLPMIAQ
jgi:hypothetical protein